ncbi:MAG TPA: nuclear transport factor 2 family protein [Actinomycetota bacterium]|nr:nuclear transport factor 2 family protein [Actinomycetota bacterium]
MVDKEDIELVRTGYNAFVAGDMEWLNEHLHANVVWHAAGRSSLAGDYRGREEVLASFANSVQIAMPEFEIHDVAAGEDHVVTVLDVTWRRPDGGTFEGKGGAGPSTSTVARSWSRGSSQRTRPASMRSSRARPPSIRDKRLTRAFVDTDRRVDARQPASRHISPSLLTAALRRPSRSLDLVPGPRSRQRESFHATLAR